MCLHIYPITQSRVSKAVNRITAGRISIKTRNQWKFMRRYMSWNGFSYRRLRKLQAKSMQLLVQLKQ